MKRDPRLEELLVQRALMGLSDAEKAKLEALGGADDDSFDRAVAALELATRHDEGLPASLVEKLVASAPVQPVTGRRRIAPAPARAAAVWPAWFAAAAGVLLALGAWGWAASRPKEVVTVVQPAPPATSSTPSAAPAPTPAEQRAVLLARGKDVQRVDWKGTKDDAARGVSGDVVWSTAEQQGYMRFVGLAPNDTARAQYQLWIFDKDRDAKYPVDGGVFDVGPAGEVIVPIRAKLHVDQPTLFAVTIEKPGGVVVSKREHIVVVASPAG